MELICPSCEARYQLPEGSITAKGRQVSCMNCGHGWHALPPMSLGDPAAGGHGRQPSEPGGIRYEPPAGAPRPGERRVQETPYSEMGGGTGPIPTPPSAGAGPVEAAGSAEPAGATAARSDQMAEIRQMLAEVQSEERARDALRPEAERTIVSAAPAAGAAAASGLRAAEDEAEMARARLQQEREEAERAAQRARAEEEEARSGERDFRRRVEEKKKEPRVPKKTDVKKLRRSHDRKVNRRKRAEKAGSGAFLTGFLLIAIIAATMVALYVLAPQIVERVPAAEEPMREYVATMDRLRAGASETIANLQAWFEAQFNEEE